MSIMDDALDFAERHAGGLMPDFTAEREIFHGDRSQTLTAGVLWLRLRLEVSINLPYGRRWDPR